jgi:hypothetical protein
MKVVHIVKPVDLNIHIIITHTSVILPIDPNANTVGVATITRIHPDQSVYMILILVYSVQPVNTTTGIDGHLVLLVPGVIPPLLARLPVPWSRRFMPSGKLVTESVPAGILPSGMLVRIPVPLLVPRGVTNLFPLGRVFCGVLVRVIVNRTVGSSV